MNTPHAALAPGFVAPPFPSPLRRARQTLLSDCGVRRAELIGGARPPRAQSATPPSLTTRGNGTKQGASFAPARSLPRGRGQPQPRRLRSPVAACPSAADFGRRRAACGIAGQSTRSADCPHCQAEVRPAARGQTPTPGNCGKPMQPCQG